MLIKDVTYKGISLSDDNAQANHIVLQTAEFGIDLRTEQYDKQNYHGSYTSHTISGGRLFTFTGYVFGASKALRYIWEKILEDLLIPEPFPSDTNRGYYELSYKDDNGVSWKTQAKVFSKPKWTHEIDSPVVEFTFELFAEDPRLVGTTLKTVSGGIGYNGGMNLYTKLPAQMDNVVGGMTAVNSWNFPALLRIEITGTLVNPKIIIGDRWYKLNTSTTSLVFTNENGKMSVTDNGVDVSSYRATGSKNLFVSSGSNPVQVQSDNYYDWPEVTTTLYFRDTII